MKIKTILTLTILALSSNLFSQGNIAFALQILNNDNNPINSLSISAIETSTFKTVKGLTDHNGNILLELNSGKSWSISVGEIQKCVNISSIPYSVVEMSQVYYYDLESHKRKKNQNFNRTSKGFNIIEQSTTKDEQFDPPNCMLVIKMKHPNGNVLSDINVGVVNVKDSIIYKDKTNNNGEAYFIIPKNNSYDIDINNFKNYTFSDFGDEYSRKPLTIAFAPTLVDEKVVNDTVYQNILTTTEASSDRALIKINVGGGKRNGNNEQIFVRELKTGKVYSNKTNSTGQAHFLIPINHVYMVDFNYQKNADAINLMNKVAMTQGELDVFYSPDPKLEYPEKFIPSSKNLLTKSFNSFLEKQFEKPKDKPFHLKITGVNKIGQNSKEALFTLKLSSSNTYGKDVRLPLNLAFVLDKSGSMYCCERSESIKKSLWDIGNSLTNEDIVSVVLFDTEAVSVQHSSDHHLDGFQHIIENYEPGGGTNIFNGIQAGVDEILKEYDADKSNRIIILTDGYGVMPPKEITDYVALKSQEGIEFSAIGLGNSYNQSLLELIARNGNGTFNYVDNSIELSDVFLKEVKSAFNYIVKDLKIEIYYDKNLVFTNLFGYPITENSNEMVSFKIGKLPINVNQIAYLKFKINKPSSEIESNPLKVKISYFDLIKNENVSYEEKINLEWTDETNTELLLDQEEKKLYAIAILNQSLKVMAEANDNNDIKSAKKSLKQGVKQMEGIFPSAKPKDVKNLLDEVNKYIQLFNQIEKND